MPGLIISPSVICIVNTSYCPPREDAVCNLEYVDGSNVDLIEDGLLKLINCS